MLPVSTEREDLQSGNIKNKLYLFFKLHLYAMVFHCNVSPQLLWIIYRYQVSTYLFILKTQSLHYSHRKPSFDQKNISSISNLKCLTAGLAVLGYKKNLLSSWVILFWTLKQIRCLMMLQTQQVYWTLVVRNLKLDLASITSFLQCANTSISFRFLLSHRILAEIYNHLIWIELNEIWKVCRQTIFLITRKCLMFFSV